MTDTGRDTGGSSKVLSVRLMPPEVVILEEMAHSLGVGRAEIIRSLLTRGRLPRRATTSLPVSTSESRRALIDGVNRAFRQLERTAEAIEAQGKAGLIDRRALDRAAWELSAVDADLRKALRDDRKN